MNVRVQGMNNFIKTVRHTSPFCQVLSNFACSKTEAQFKADIYGLHLR